MSPERGATDFGSKLRAARERRGISLRQIASATKISVRALDALERNDLARLPGGIFSRAFVRSYASEVGLDPDEAIEEFLSQFPHDRAAPAQDPAEADDDGEAIESERRTASTFLRLVAVSVPIAAAVVYFGAAGRTPTEPGTSATQPSADIRQTVQTSVPTAHVAQTPVPTRVPTPVPKPVPDQSATPVATTATESSLPLRVELVIRRPCWLTMTVDGDKKADRLFQPGEHQTIEVADELSFTAGDASAVKMTINGTAAKALGREGEVVTARVNPRNFRSYLAGR